MADIIKVGIMGALRGTTFARNLKLMKDVEFTALCESNDESMEKIREHLWENTKIYKDFDEFINCGIDAVILCNYFDEHAKYATKAIKAGVAVLSETTAAPTLGECVELVEAVENFSGRYMLAANCLYFKGVHAMKKRIDAGLTGKVMYGEAEYIHGTYIDQSTAEIPEIDYDNLHWRKTMPPNMYNMHSLGPLMYVTNSMPLKVSCKMIRNDTLARFKGKVTDCVGSVVITEMDNGAIFNTTGCSGYPPTSKWYRIACEKETMETERYDHEESKLIVASSNGLETFEPSNFEAGIVDNALGISDEEIKACGHGGIDFFNLYFFIKYLRGEKEIFFDVYRAAALSAVAILGWYSALLDSKELVIPDFRKKEDRDTVRNDYRKPISQKYSEMNMPCRLDEKDKFTL